MNTGKIDHNLLIHALISQQNGSNHEDEKRKTETLPNLHVAICVGYKKIQFENAYCDLEEVINMQLKN